MTPVDSHAWIYIAGHNGLVGSAILRYLTEAGHERSFEIATCLTCAISSKSRISWSEKGRIMSWRRRQLREFLHVVDFADAIAMCFHSDVGNKPMNVGTGKEISIAGLAKLVSDVVGFEGNLEFDATKPDGMPRKVSDISRIAELGWRPSIGLRDGIERTYRWYTQNRTNG